MIADKMALFVFFCQNLGNKRGHIAIENSIAKNGNTDKICIIFFK